MSSCGTGRTVDDQNWALAAGASEPQGGAHSKQQALNQSMFAHLEDGKAPGFGSAKESSVTKLVWCVL